MSPIIIGLAVEMKRILKIIFVFVIFICVGYFYLESDIGLFSDVTLIRDISSDVLGNPNYGKSCPRSSYIKTVESHLGNSDKESAYFVFRPIQGKEKECPPIAIIASRRTGETWITDSPK
jgi:hypothetical protein